jgi:Protein of unknown function (DUF3168)
MMLDGFMALLKADAGVSGLVGVRVYQSVLPRGYILPAIAIHRYGGSQDYEYAGPVGVREDQIQLDAYGETAESLQQVSEAIRSLLVPYVGTLPDGTVVQACYLERDMDMPFLPNADTKGIANRSTLGFRVVSTRV